MQYDIGLMWFRRDLRIDDNAALFHALKTCRRVYALFVFDTNILSKLEPNDRRVAFIHACLEDLNRQIKAINPAASLIVAHGPAQECVIEWVKTIKAEVVMMNHDDEPYSTARDQNVQQELQALGVSFCSFKDHVIFERNEVLSQVGKPYTVFTPYSKSWLNKLNNDAFYIKQYPVEKYAANLSDVAPVWQKKFAIPSLTQLGFNNPASQELAAIPPGSSGAQHLLNQFLPQLANYAKRRDFPASDGGSFLSPHLRFGTISIRRLVGLAKDQIANKNPGASMWLNEFIWREFYAQIMFHFPHACQSAFKTAYDNIEFEQGAKAEKDFKRWCEGNTGFPLIDAAMRQLNQTGYMHNRLRMVTASFLCKDLGLDWRWGERYFAQQLLDFELSSNNGGWQWAASSGCDAQPYFRIFNPITQSQKFDPNGDFIKRYCPELQHLPPKFVHQPSLAPTLELQFADVRFGENYPLPMVDHASAREKTLVRYSVVKQST